MNREILFRGKRDDNGEWVYGYFVADALEQIGRDCPMGWIRYYNDDTEKVEIYQIDRKTVGQYTGLKDKNGTKIFEGDIVKFQHDAMGEWIGDIFWDYEERGWNAHLRYLGKCEPLFVGEVIGLGYSNEMYEVIGNIYDTPKLLEVGND